MKALRFYNFGVNKLEVNMLTEALAQCSIVKKSTKQLLHKEMKQED